MSNTVQPEVHSHRCTKCGEVWFHNATAAGEAETHKCPNCGASAYVKHTVAAHRPAKDQEMQAWIKSGVLAAHTIASRLFYIAVFTLFIASVVGAWYFLEEKTK